MKSAMISDEGQQLIFLRSCNFYLQSRLMWRPSPPPGGWRSQKVEPLLKTSWRQLSTPRDCLKKNYNVRSYSKHIIVISHQVCKTGSPPCCGWQSKEGIGCEDFSESISSERITGSQLQGKLHSVTQLFQISQFVSFSEKQLGVWSPERLLCQKSDVLEGNALKFKAHIMKCHWSPK